MKFAYLLLLPFLVLTSCTDYSLDKYAKEVRSTTTPTPEVYNIIIDTLSPEKSIATCYFDIKSRWRYQQDPQKADHFQNAGNLLREEFPTGDCEDFASIMMAICRAMNINSQICLGINSSKTSGHAWTELELCNVGDYSKNVEDFIQASFDNQCNIVERNGKMWIQLNFGANPRDYKLYCSIDTLGAITKFYH